MGDSKTGFAVNGTYEIVCEELLRINGEKTVYLPLSIVYTSHSPHIGKNLAIQYKT